MALQPSPWTSHRSRTAGTAAQYVPRNGTAPRIAARAVVVHHVQEVRKPRLENLNFTNILGVRFY